MSIQRSKTTIISDNYSITPKQQRINIIEEKLNYINQSKVKIVNSSNHEQLQKRINNIERHITDNLREMEFKVREFRENLKDSDRKFNQNKSRFQLSHKLRRQEISDLQRKIYEYISMQTEARRESQNRLLQIFEERFQQMTLQLAKNIEMRKKYFNELDEDLSNTLPMLNSEAKQQLQEWNMRFQELDEMVSQQLENFRQQIKQQQLKREKSYEHLMDMMNSVINQIKRDLTEEKKAREDNNKKLMKLFEGACQKLKN